MIDSTGSLAGEWQDAHGSKVLCVDLKYTLMEVLSTATYTSTPTVNINSSGIFLSPANNIHWQNARAYCQAVSRRPHCMLAS